MMLSAQSADLDGPAFPLNFDPELLLNDESQAEDFHQWLQNELDIFSVDSPASDQPDALQHGVSGSDNSTSIFPSSSSQQGVQPTPGIVELFQVHALAPGGNATSQVPIQQTPWMGQQLQQQQHQQQQFLQQQQQQQLQPQVAVLTPFQQQHMHASQPYAAATSSMLQPSMMFNQQPLQMPQQIMPDTLYQQPYQMQGQVMEQQSIMLMQQLPQYVYVPQLQQQPGGHMAAPTVMQSMQQQQFAYSAPQTVSYMAPAGPTMYGGMPANSSYTMSAAYVAPVAALSNEALASPNSNDQEHAIGSTAAAAAGRTGSGGNKPSKSRSKAVTAVVTAVAVASHGAEKTKGQPRRFRERQKETISNLEAEVTEKLAQLQALSAENEMLKLRSAVLEATVKGREYHMKIIKEHGPPVFDASEVAEEMFTTVQHAPSNCTDVSGNSQSAVSNGVLNPLRSSFSDTDCENAEGVGGATTDGETAAAAGISKAYSGLSHASTASGAAALEGSLPSALSAGAANNGAANNGQQATGEAAPAGGDGGCALTCCDAPQMCSPAEQKKTIRTLKHMSAEEIIRHWKQFVHDVTGELLIAEQEQEQKLRRLAHSASDAATASPEACDPSSATTSAAASVAKACRWCSYQENEEHTAEACEAEQLRQGTTAPSHASTAAEDKAFQREMICGSEAVSCTLTEARITALVNKYSYMTKFVALLNPGVLYHLFGRHLDTGLPAPYSDDHWRQVVSRLGLSKHQVTVILACAELYFSSLSRLLDQRRMLQQQLKHADEGLSECQRRLLGVDGGLNQLQVLDALASNLKREHVLRIMLNCFVWGRSLNSLQFAKSAVYSYPFFPDVHAMVCVLYEDARAMAPNGQPALVFPHRQAKAATDEQQQQQSQLQALHEQLKAESDGLRAEAEQLQQKQQLHNSPGQLRSSGSISAGLSDIDLVAVLTA